MFSLKGKYAEAVIYTDNVQDSCISQIYGFLNNEAFKDLKIRIMPDTHSGEGAVIGFTSTIKDKVIPNVVGVDVGCGMRLVKLKEKSIDLAKLDEVIKTYVPSGARVHKKAHKYNSKIDLSKLRCAKNIGLLKAEYDLGTLGGGNHFIEGNIDKDGNIYLVVHTGSRYLGKQVAEYYQELAYKTLKKNYIDNAKLPIIEKYKAEGREKEIQTALDKIKVPKINKALAYLEGSNMDDYIHDIDIVQKYSSLNRKAIMDIIVEKMGVTVVDSFETIHNYIDVENMIIRKGAIKADKGERVIIPISRKDGSIIAIGKGNPDWNNSAPHGAGRLMSRAEAKSTLKLEDDLEDMKGIYSTTVNEFTLDESSRAYKPLKEILDNITDTVDVIEVIKPIYNYKDTSENRTLIFIEERKEKKIIRQKALEKAESIMKERNINCDNCTFAKTCKKRICKIKEQIVLEISKE